MERAAAYLANGTDRVLVLLRQDGQLRLLWLVIWTSGDGGEGRDGRREKREGSGIKRQRRSQGRDREETEKIEGE